MSEQKGVLTTEEFMALHRHWIWAGLIKKQFEPLAAEGNKKNCDAGSLFLGPYGAYMSIWYGMLFGVLDVLKKRDISIPAIQADIDGIFSSLHMYRNAVFHPQPEYFSHKLLEVMKDKDSVRKIWNVHAGLGSFFLSEVKKLNAGIKSEYVLPSPPTKRLDSH